VAQGDITFFNAYKATGGIDPANDTIKAILVVGYTLDIDNDTTYADVSGVESSGSGYTAGGETLTSTTLTQDNSNDRGVWDAGNVQWDELYAHTPSHLILYDSDVSNTLILAVELNEAALGGVYRVEWNATGISTLT